MNFLHIKPKEPKISPIKWATRTKPKKTTPQFIVISFVG